MKFDRIDKGAWRSSGSRSGLVTILSAFAQTLPRKSVMAQIASIQQVKQNLTPAQKKMDSSLAFAVVGQKNPACR